MKKNKLLLTLVAVLCSGMSFAQVPNCPDCDTGGQGPGKQSVPIDMYVYVLAIAAILMIIFFAKKYKTQKI